MNFMSDSAKNIFAIILNWNNYGDTEKCVESLSEVSSIQLNIIIVDNFSDDGSFEKLKNRFFDKVILRTEKNLGYAGGMNLGINYALNNNASHILISNNDMTYEKDFFLPSLKLIESNEKIGIVSPKVLYMHDKSKIYCAGGDFILHRASGVAAYRNQNATTIGLTERKISMAEGSCFLAKAEVFSKCGIFNEKFFMYFEDLEFSDRVRKYFEIWFTPESIVYHKGGGGLSWESHSPLYYYYYTRNRYLYFNSYNLSVKLYVQFYSLLISLLKSFVLLKSIILMGEMKKNIQSLKMLVKANLLGIRLLWGNPNDQFTELN